MILSRRCAAEDPLNTIARTRAALEASGVQLLELSDSNPTRHDLLDPAVADVLARTARTSTCYDPDPRGPIVAREALAEYAGGSPDDYWLTPGTSAAYGWLFALLTDPGEQVAIPQPGYPLLEPLARLAGTGLVRYPSYYLHPHGWEYDLDALDRLAADPATRAVVVVNPNNPTGAAADQADALIELCCRQDGCLVADEVFAPFGLDAATGRTVDSPGIRRLAGTSSVLSFGLDGLSKLLAAPHLKLGWIRLSGPRKDVARVAPVLDRIADAYLPASGPTAAALPDLLRLAPTSVARIGARLRQNLATARTLFTGPGYRVRRCDGGWTVLVDIPRVLPEDDVVLALLRRGIAVQPGWFFDLDSPGTLALSLLPADFAERCGLLKSTLDALG
ncbi:MAG: pyridoxal phosphate-dependent aminotransferase [Propionicimonas sp.]|uniref:pyridoxal phosphate-dependent aminotransferase n=1 Tax=Propionicimonas sp. TaxID=1955623 RepID=UPI002B1ED5A5|nr:pyridoxal phosphate-dependent aminotransferase [Propionicimonas sp.]MEA4944030.1 pyridoxal phosphate-dependent aminotransferase [Propionicimonas sp.]